MEFLMELCRLQGKKIILASQSPRRIELLRGVGLKFEIVPAQVDENVKDGDHIIDAARHYAREKAHHVADRHSADLIIAADTLVVLGNEIFAKPKNRVEAGKMLRQLSGATHSVITGLSLLTPASEILDHEETRVTFWDISKREIDAYLNTPEPFDKAGAYGIQGYAALFIRKIEGSYFNVMGFPLSKFYQHLRTLFK